MFRRKQEKQQYGQRDGGDAVAANGAIAGWPGEHQYIENRHELFRPKQAGKPEGQRDLYGQGKSQRVRDAIEVGKDHISFNLLHF